jgi:aryl-alcohol dehydrogenase-like predicted oxidoreductase
MTDEQHGTVTRRSFVKGTGVWLGSAAASQALAMGQASAADDARDAQVPREVLGRTGVKVSRLGLGCAWFQRKHVVPEDVRQVLHRALDLGVDYLDVAPNYGNAEIGFSEEKMGPTIKDIRERVFLVTKTEEPTYEGTWQLLRQSMRRLQTDHFDLVHLHNFGHEPRFPDIDFTFGDKGALGALCEAKKMGVVRFIGASGHLHPSRFHDVLDTGEIDVLMNAVNFVVQHTYDFESKLWARARRENVGLVAMKVLGGGGGGGGFRLPADQYENAIRYALSIPAIACAVIGIENIAELEQAARTVASARPLTDQEAHELARLGLELAGTEPWKAAYGTPVA